MFKSKTNSTQKWFPIQEFYNDGIIKLKNGEYVKIIKVYPINYELKSNFEKKTILSSYKAFLKNCNFEIQIIIQSNREDLSQNIKKIKKQQEKENSLNNNVIVNIMEQYINFIEKKNKEKLSSSKNFFILIKSQKSHENSKENIIQNLKEKYFKIKDSLSRCGNSVYEIKEKDEIINIISSFLNKKSCKEKANEGK